MRKRFVLVLVLVLALSSLIMVEPDLASAQTTTPTPPPVTPSSSPALTPTPTPTAPTPTPTPTPNYPKPLIPQFTVKFIRSLPEANKTSIELAIKNQPFDRNNSYHYAFYINVRTKIGNSDWREIYRPEDGFPTQSSSDYTILSFSSSDEYSGYFVDAVTSYPYSSSIYAPANSSLDVQVEAMIGYVSRVFNPNSTSQLDMYPYKFTGVTSGWSNTQTITISDSPTPSPSPTQQEPFPVMPLAVVFVAVFVVCAGLLVYFKKRKHEA